MAFNPFDEKGIPIEKQPMSWSDLDVQPYDKNTVHPYTRTRIILMNGIEVESVFFLHQFARHSDNLQINQQLAMIRRMEQQQQKLINWLIPGNESPLEVTIGYEQVAVDLTAELARSEPDPYIKQALDFAMLEDFDHLYRYSNLLDLKQPGRPQQIVGDETEIMPGRPTVAEHRHPYDSVRKHYDNATADILTKLHVETIVSAEQQTMNFYMNVGPQAMEQLGRGLYQEIAMIEEQHVSQYEALADPRVSWLDMLVLHDYNECYMYYSCAESEPEPRIKNVWNRLLEMEITHLQLDRELVQRVANYDPADSYPASFPHLTTFHENKDYIRNVLQNQIDLTARETEFVPVGSLPENYRYFEYQKQVNDDFVPSQNIIRRHIDDKGADYRVETQGKHPVRELQVRESLPPEVARG